MAYSPPPAPVKSAEWTVLAEMNKIRARHGIGPLRMAGRVRLVARDRSRSMKNQGYFAHVSPSGVSAPTLLNRRSVQYRRWAENIGWTKYFQLEAGAKWMVDWWKNSPSHRRHLLDPRLNYAGIGIAKDGPKTLYTVNFVSQRDHTPPMVGLLQARTGIAVASVGRPAKVTVRWWGRDRKLSSGTAGLRSFSVQYKRGDGSWRPLLTDTNKRQVTVSLARGTHTFRVRGVDRNGNRSGWQRPLVVTVS